MKEILEKWQEVESERCLKVWSNGDYMVVLDNTSYTTGNDSPDYLSSLQVAIQQAIEARDGWTWSLMKDTAGTYKARVWTNDVVYHHVNSNSSPAEALLSAYLQALEAVKTQEVVG